MVEWFETFSLNFSILLCVIRVSLLHPGAFMVWYYLCGVSLSL